MPMLPAEDYQPNERLRSLGIDAYPSSFGDVLGATAEEAWIRNPTPSLLREAQRQAREPAPVGIGAEFGAEALGPAVPSAKMLTAEEANQRFGLGKDLTFDRDTPEQTAQDLYDLKREELRRKSVFSRAQGRFLEGAAQFGVGLAASVIDPLNIASAFIPVVGPARYALWAQRFGTTGARAARGAVEGFAGAALLEPAVYAVAQSEQADYDAMDSLLNLAFGTVLGGGLHVGLGRLSDYLSQERLTEPALRASVANLVDERPVDVGEVITRRLPTGGIQRVLPVENLARGREAAARVLDMGEDVPAAMYREDLGEIAFNVGQPGTESKQFKDGSGLSHIVARRDLEDADGETFVRDRLPEVLTSGRLEKLYGPPTGRRADIVLGDDQVTLSLFRHGQRETWVLTGYERWKGTSGPGGTGGLNPTGPTRPRPPGIGGEAGAGPRANIERAAPFDQRDPAVLPLDEQRAVAAVDAIVTREPAKAAPKAEGAEPLGPKSAEAQAELDSVMQQIEAAGDELPAELKAADETTARAESDAKAYEQARFCLSRKS